MRPSSPLAMFACAAVVAAGATAVAGPAGVSALSSSAAQSGPATQQPATNIALGERPPSALALAGLDGGDYAIADAEGPLLLLFFRGAW